MIPDDTLMEKFVELTVRSHAVVVIGVGLNDDAPSQHETPNKGRFDIDAFSASVIELSTDDLIAIFEFAAESTRIGVERAKIVDEANRIINESEES